MICQVSSIKIFNRTQAERLQTKKRHMTTHWESALRVQNVGFESLIIDHFINDPTEDLMNSLLIGSKFKFKASFEYPLGKVI